MGTSKQVNQAKLISVPAAARQRGVYVRRLWAAIRDGTLPAYQIGGWLRVRLEDVDQWIENRRINPRQRPRRERAAPTRSSNSAPDETTG